MADSMTTDREEVVTGFKFANSAVSIEAAPAASRTNLRATSAGSKSFGKSIALDLPTKMHQTASKAGRHALKLGPDEWLIIDTKNIDETMVPRLANKNFSAVDISHRNCAFILSGEGAANTLNAACPRDLSLATFPVGACSRTLFGKAEVVLYRTAKDTFRLECWRSFATYVRDYLIEGAKDVHI